MKLADPMAESLRVVNTVVLVICEYLSYLQHSTMFSLKLLHLKEYNEQELESGV